MFLHADYLGLFGLEALFQLPAGLLQLLRQGEDLLALFLVFQGERGKGLLEGWYLRLQQQFGLAQALQEQELLALLLVRFFQLLQVGFEFGDLGFEAVLWGDPFITILLGIWFGGVEFELKPLDELFGLYQRKLFISQLLGELFATGCSSFEVLLDLGTSSLEFGCRGC